MRQHGAQLCGLHRLAHQFAAGGARQFDRFHALEQSLVAESSPESMERAQATKVSLARRARLIHWAITLCTVCDLLVCLVIAALFVGAELQVALPSTIAGLFIAAMLALIAGLVCFLREIALSTSVIESLDRSASSSIAPS